MAMSNLLQNTRILLTRQAEQNVALSTQLTNLGAQCLAVPLFEIEETLDAAKLWSIKRGLSLSSLAIFISSNATKILLSRLALGPDLLCACVGPATAKLLQQAGYYNVLFPRSKPYDSAGLIRELQLNNLNLKNRYIMVFAGENGNRNVVADLQKLGAVVELVEIYKRQMPALASQLLAAAIGTASPDIIVISCVTSLTNLQYLASKLNIIWQEIPLLVVSERIREHALGLGFAKVYTAASMTDEDIVSALIKWRSLNKQV